MAKESDFLDGFIDILRTYVTQQRKQNGILEPLPELPAPQPVAAQQESLPPKKVTEACPAEKSSEVVSIEVDDDDEETAEEQKTEDSGDNCDDDGDDEKENTSDEERTVPPLNPIAAAVSRIIQKRPKHDGEFQCPLCMKNLSTLADYDEHSIDCLMTPKTHIPSRDGKTVKIQKTEPLHSGLKRCFNPAIGLTLDEHDDSHESLVKSKKLKLDLLGKMEDS